MGIPAGLSWPLVTGYIADLLSNSLVLAAVGVSMALIFAPRIIYAVKMASSPSFRQESHDFDRMVRENDHGPYLYDSDDED